MKPTNQLNKIIITKSINTVNILNEKKGTKIISSFLESRHKQPFRH